jgi:hypothetical protein
LAGRLGESSGGRPVTKIVDRCQAAVRTPGAECRASPCDKAMRCVVTRSAPRRRAAPYARPHVSPPNTLFHSGIATSAPLFMALLFIMGAKEASRTLEGIGRVQPVGQRAKWETSWRSGGRSRPSGSDPSTAGAEGRGVVRESLAEQLHVLGYAVSTKY